MTATARVPSSALQPMADRMFRMLLLAWLAGNMTMWMNDVSAAWLMAQLTDAPSMVSLVQATASLPVFVLGLPFGTVADIVDRRLFYAFANFWIGIASATLAALAALGWVTPTWLLLACLANGIGLAMRYPVFSALVPDLVPREQMAAALTLNAVAFNVTRLAGPLLAGAVIASLGMAAIFALDAALSFVACWLIWRWAPRGRQAAAAAPLRPAGMVAAMGGGLAFVWRSVPMRNVVLRSFVFFLHVMGIMALLPLVAKRLSSGATVYTVLLASMGLGAIVAAFALPGVANARSRDRVVVVGTLLYAGATVVAVLSGQVWLTALALAVCGGVWLCVANTMTMSAQLTLPSALRARGMAIYQMAIMGGGGLGAAFWGQVASHTSLQTGLMISAASGALALLPTWRLSVNVAPVLAAPAGA